ESGSRRLGYQPGPPISWNVMVPPWDASSSSPDSNFAGPRPSTGSPGPEDEELVPEPEPALVLVLVPVVVDPPEPPEDVEPVEEAAGSLVPHAAARAMTAIASGKVERCADSCDEWIMRPPRVSQVSHRRAT